MPSQFHSFLHAACPSGFCSPNGQYMLTIHRSKSPREYHTAMPRPSIAGSLGIITLRTIFDVLKKAHMDGYAGVRIIGGGDRVKEFENLSGNYNGKLYQFDNIEVTSAGDRDPDAEGTEGMSASKQRKAAAENDFKSFRQGVPKSMDDKAAKMLFNTLRKSMKLQEGWRLWQIAPKYDWKNLRENYVAERIYRIGQVIENDNTGLIGEIIRRGTNHLICVTEDGIMFKS